MTMNAKRYKDEVGHIEIAYACGHTLRHRYCVTKHTKAGTKSFILHGFGIDEDLSICPYCRLHEQEKKEKEAKP